MERSIYLIENSAQKLIEKHIEGLSKEGFDISIPEKKKFNFEASVKSGKESLKLQVFFGKKGIKTVLQGNQESKLYKKVNSILFGENLFLSPEIVEPESYIGIDESGKGDYFGPLVVAAVFVNKSIIEKLKIIGVKDSKELTDQVISIIAKKMKKIEGFIFDVIEIYPDKYNLLPFS